MLRIGRGGAHDEVDEMAALLLDTAAEVADEDIADLLKNRDQCVVNSRQTKSESCTYDDDKAAELVGLLLATLLLDTTDELAIADLV